MTIVYKMFQEIVASLEILGYMERLNILKAVALIWESDHQS
jgi:hypothetical protein